MSLQTIAVSAERDYQVFLGQGALSELTNLIAPTVDKVALIIPKDLKELAQSAIDILESLDVSLKVLEVENSEAAKNYATAIKCWDFLGENKFTRSDLIIGLGGGATTDLAGFVAATWLRGVDCILIPTSLLAMVDAAIGGKTGINTDTGKNLVGVFASPKAVICELNFLKTLPKADLAAGLAEVIKCGFIHDTSILDLFENHFDISNELDLEVLQTLIQKAILTKAEIVGADFKETSSSNVSREILNYGHTLGHAIEKLENFSWRHGDAISVGMVFAAELANQAGLLDQAAVNRHRELLAKLQLPLSYQADDLMKVLEVMAVDKKARGKSLRFVVLKDFGMPTRLETPSIEIIKNAWQKVATK